MLESMLRTLITGFMLGSAFVIIVWKAYTLGKEATK